MIQFLREFQEPADELLWVVVLVRMQFRVFAEKEREMNIELLLLGPYAFSEDLESWFYCYLFFQINQITVFSY